MNNLFAISLVLASLFAAAVWSPSTQHDRDHREQVIVKEGHRVVVVEYDKEADGTTKVMISPNDVVAGEKHGDGIFSGTRERVCDAYGKCKDKIASAFGKTKDTVEETVHEASEKAQELETRAKDGVAQGIDKVKEGMFSGPKEVVCDAYGKCKHKIADAFGKTKDKVEETVHEVSDKAWELERELEKHAKEGVGHGIDKAKKVAGGVVETVKEGAVKVKNLDVLDSANTLQGDIGRNVSGKVHDIAKETVESVHKVSEKSLGEILGKLKDVAHDVMLYMVSRDKIDAVVGLVHMLGFSTAYGMCVWVTFISTYILGRYLPKQQFGLVQSRIYPVYFKAMAYCISAALLGHLASRKYDTLIGMIGFQGSVLFLALVTVLTNMILVEPRATKTLFERTKIEKEEGRGVAGPTRDGIVAPTSEVETDQGGANVVRTRVANVVAERPGVLRANVVTERPDISRLNGKLKRYNAYSVALNLSTLVALTWHMGYIGRQLHATR